VLELLHTVILGFSAARTFDLEVVAARRPAPYQGNLTSMQASGDFQAGRIAIRQKDLAEDRLLPHPNAAAWRWGAHDGGPARNGQAARWQRPACRRRLVPYMAVTAVRNLKPSLLRASPHTYPTACSRAGGFPSTMRATAVTV